MLRNKYILKTISFYNLTQVFYISQTNESLILLFLDWSKERRKRTMTGSKAPHYRMAHTVRGHFRKGTWINPYKRSGCFVNSHRY